MSHWNGMNAPLAALSAAVATPPPWLLPYLPLAQRVVAGTSSQSVADALNDARGSADSTLRFVEHSALVPGDSYESFIARTGSIPTRDNLHDLFNGLVWLSYPQAKRRLNALQSQSIARLGTTGTRGSLRDGLTVFDENAALLQAPTELVDALRRRDWKGLFLTQRALWQSGRLVVFGHALMEKLMQPRKAITAHVWIVPELTDATVAASVTPERIGAKLFLPLPVLGVPGWWPANEDPAFYDDADVFRPPRTDSQLVFEGAADTRT
jgi:Protein of unknown function (DUF3025)